MAVVELLHAVDGDLLECPVWDQRDAGLLFVDLRRPARHRLDWASGALGSSYDVPTASAVLPAAGSGVVVAERGRVTLDGAPVPGPVLDADVRFNDAAVDRAGRLWVGTMAEDARPGAGTLLRLDPDLAWTQVLADVTISNGLDWSPDDRTLYHVDSATRRVDAFDHDPGSGDIRGRRVLVDLGDHDGMPDGLCVDAEGCVWVASYGGGAVRRFAPDGRLLATHVVPVPRVTSLCFAGPDLDVLVITVRGDATGDDGRPAGAHLYALTTTTRGLPATPFGG